MIKTMRGEDLVRMLSVKAGRISDNVVHRYIGRTLGDLGLPGRMRERAVFPLETGDSVFAGSDCQTHLTLSQSGSGAWGGISLNGISQQ